MSLRSQKWLAGDDEVALAHRVALRSIGLDIDADDPRPIIGIADSSSDLNPCNLPLRGLADAVADGIRAAGGHPVRFPTMSLGEDLMKPSAFLYRNLLAIEIEETLRSNPLDGVVVLANCDKTVPAVLMGAASANLPTIAVLGGARPVTTFRGKSVGTGTDLWRLWEERRAGRMDDAGWRDLESCLACGLGACNTMGTASTMAILTEALGLALPGLSTAAAESPQSLEGARSAGARVVELVAENIRPRDILTPAAFDNAARVLHSIGGSTNAVIHLAAIAGRVGISLDLARVGDLGRGLPLLADVEPSGSFLIHDFHSSGGLPAVQKQLAPYLDCDVVGVSGLSLRHIAGDAPEPSGAIRSAAKAIGTDGSLAVLKGNLAPDGAVIKKSAATPALFTHTGPALVFHSYDDMRLRVDDPGLDVSADTVLILSGAGPVGVPGMPEWGMIPIPAKLAAAGVTDMVRITDSRMSGTSFGTVILHAAPEGAIGGAIGLVRDGDLIHIDVEAGLIEVQISDLELKERSDRWVKPVSEHLRGWPALYQAHVMQAPNGCDFDFLQAPTAEHLRFVEPVVGRS